MSDLKNAVDTVGVEISAAEKDAFFRCFLADEPYTEEVGLFGDKFKVTFKTLTLAENNDVLKQIKLDQKSGVAEDTDQYFITISTYRLATALTHINGLEFNDGATEKVVQLANDPNLTLVKLKAQVFHDWPTYKLTAVIDAFRKFEQKVMKLTTEVTEPNFWKAAK